MDEGYAPPSDFLRAVAADEAPLAGPFGEANLRCLVAMTRDHDASNRDWATFLLAQTDADTGEIRAALLTAAEDEDPDVRAEAIAGIARRDRQLALPLVQAALDAGDISRPIAEAAALVADARLVKRLRALVDPSDDAQLDSIVLEALEACLEGKPRDII